MNFSHLINDKSMIERLLLVLVVGMLGYACMQIVSPFIPPFIWATILVLSTWPYYLSLATALGDRKGLASGLLTTLMLLVFVVPAILAFDAVGSHLPLVDDWLVRFMAWLKGEPPEWLGHLPWVGEKLDADWRGGRLQSLVDPAKIRPLLTTLGKWLLQGGAGLALSALNIILAVLMAGMLYSYGDKAALVTQRLALRIGGEDALKATQIAANTIRGVSLGVIGTAMIQAILSGIGFAIAGITAAPLLGLLCFLGAVMQIGTSIVWIPVAGWLVHQGSDNWASFTVVWGLAINIMDNFVKPYFIGLSSPLPFLLIMVGVVGGLLAWGFVGIFLGTTLLAVAYTVFFAWLDSKAPPPREETGCVPE
ncbi:MAG: AI-2E family transporter [Methylococcaceae bacterium]